MKTWHCFMALVLCLFMVREVYGREVRRVEIRTYPTVGGMEIAVDNKFGDIVVRAWDRNEVSFSVEIVGKARKEEMAGKMANRVKVSFSRTSGLIAARTSIVEKRENCSDCRVEIHYTIQLPRNVCLNLTNKYGNIFVDVTDMPFRGEIKYGDLQVGELNGKRNRIHCRYGNVHVKKSKVLMLESAYSDVVVDKAGKLTMGSSYSGIRIGEVKDMAVNSRYDNFQIKCVDQLVAEPARNTQFRVEELGRSFVIEGLAHGEVKISRVAEGFARVVVDATYSNVWVGIDSLQGAQLDVTSRYGQVKVGNHLNTTRLNGTKNLEEAHGIERLVGLLGDGKNTKSVIVIKNTYGKVRIGE